MQKHILLESPDGYEVYVDLINSRAGKYISSQPYVATLIKEILSKKKLPKKKDIILEHDLGRAIGNCYTVVTSEKDTIFYALPVKKTTMQRFVRHRQPEQTTHLTILVSHDDEGNFEVTDTWLGNYCPPFPSADLAQEESLSFWDNHAIIADMHDIQQRTITSERPF